MFPSIFRRLLRLGFLLSLTSFLIPVSILFCFPPISLPLSSILFLGLIDFFHDLFGVVLSITMTSVMSYKLMILRSVFPAQNILLISKFSTILYKYCCISSDNTNSVSINKWVISHSNPICVILIFSSVQTASSNLWLRCFDSCYTWSLLLSPIHLIMKFCGIR